MQDTLAVTVRYFGGIKLGAGGLIRAYSKSVANALDHAVLTQKEIMQEYTLSFSYDLVGKLDYYFRSHQIEISDKQYDEEVCYTFLSKTDVNDDILEITNGKYQAQFQKEILLDVEVHTIEE